MAVRHAGGPASPGLRDDVGEGAVVEVEGDDGGREALAVDRGGEGDLPAGEDGVWPADADEDHLVEGVAFGSGEGPAAEVAVVGGEVAGGDAEPEAGDDEDEQPVGSEKAGVVGEGGVLGAPALGVDVVGRVEEEQPEGAVGEGR